jgi:O-antigen ligase
MALYLLVGRWTPTRLVDPDAGGDALQPRYLVAAMLVLLTLLCRAVDRPGADRKVRTRGVVTGLSVTLFLYLIVSASWAELGQFRFGRMIDMGIVLVGTACLHQLLNAENVDLMVDWFWRALSLCAASLAALAAVPGLASGQRMAVLGGGANSFGKFMGLLFIGAFYLLGITRRSWYWGVAMAVAPVMVILSGSRGATLGTITGIIACLLLRPFRLREAAIIVCLGVAMIVLLRNTELADRAIWMYEERIRTFGTQTTDMAGRAPLFTAAIDLGREHLFLGAGLSSFSAVMGEDTYPHNVVLEVFSEAGLIGLLLLASAIILGACRAVTNRDERGWAAVAALALTFTASQFSGDLYDSRGVFAFLLIALASRRAGGGRANIPGDAQPALYRRVPCIPLLQNQELTARHRTLRFPGDAVNVKAPDRVEIPEYCE